jgi:hypothetical protein
LPVGIAASSVSCMESRFWHQGLSLTAQRAARSCEGIVRRVSAGAAMSMSADSDRRSRISSDAKADQMRRHGRASEARNGDPSGRTRLLIARNSLLNRDNSPVRS